MLVGWITIHVTEDYGSVAPFSKPSFDDIYAPDPTSIPTSPTSSSGGSWTTPEPGAALLLARGAGGVGFIRRRTI